MASSQGKVPKSCLHHLEKSPKKELHVTINADHQCFETELYDGEKEWLEEQKKETVTTSTELTEKDKQWFKDYMAFSMGIYFGPQSEPLLDEVTFEGIARYMASDKCTKIVVLAGAGISTSAGIPDFRTPGTGLYDMLKNKYKMDDPQKAFDWNYFMADPKPFFEIRKEKFQGDYKPTPTHYFIKLLENKNKLLRYFTQNIDGLDRQVGLDPRRVTEAHGTMETATCTFCEKQYSKEEMKAQMLVAEDNLVPYCTEEDCGGVIKPDIVMFGENMKPSFAVDSEDVEKCDMMIILGTSLKVPPFNKLPIRTKFNVPRLLINMEKVVGPKHPMSALFFGCSFDFDNPDNKRDVFWEGQCDEGVFALAERLGWGEEFRTMVKEENAKRGVVYPPPEANKTDLPQPPKQSTSSVDTDNPKKLPSKTVSKFSKQNSSASKPSAVSKSSNQISSASKPSAVLKSVVSSSVSNRKK